MKRSPKKLDLRREMVRILADRELVVVAGGDINGSASGPAQTCNQIVVPLPTK
jgi:hypothetical protein